MNYFSVNSTIQATKQKMSELFANSQNHFVRQTPLLDATILLCHFLDCSKTELVCNAKQPINNETLLKLEDATQKRLSGLPIAYITGTKEFYGYEFDVTTDVLIPKPDTETLVEKTLNHAINLLQSSDFANADKKMAIADICTGSGCVGISILNELCKIGLSRASCDFTDISEPALTVAKQNAKKLLSKSILQQTQFFLGDLCSPLPQSKKYQIIVSNPPYVPQNITEILLQDGRSEPRLALDGDTDFFLGTSESSDGLAIIKRLSLQAKEKLVNGGLLFLETGEYNAESTKNYLSKIGFVDIIIHKDLSGLLRVVQATKN